MEKPVLVLRQEFAEKLVALINDSGLPLVLVEPIITNAANTVQLQLQAQYEAELKQYQEEQRKEHETDK